MKRRKFITLATMLPTVPLMRFVPEPEYREIVYVCGLDQSLALSCHFKKHKLWQFDEPFYRHDLPGLVETWGDYMKTTTINYVNVGYHFVDIGAKIRFYKDDRILINHFAPSGRELNWLWRPVS